MKNLVNYINESKTGDLFLTVAETIKDPKNITDADIKAIINNVKKQFGFELPEKEAKTLANSVVSEFPEMFEQ